MALSRKFLSTLGIEDDKIDEIISKHSETVNGLKDERDKFKEKAEKYDSVQEELNEIKKNQNSDDRFKLKYDAIKEEFEQFKNDIENQKKVESKKNAYIELLKDANIQEKRINSILKLSKDVYNGIEFDENGKIKDYEKLKTDAEKEWEDFRVVETKKGTKTPTPPSNDGGKSTITREDIRKIKDPILRQKKMIENPELFGGKEN